MIWPLVQNELLKIYSLVRTYIGFILIAILMPLILWGYGAGTNITARELEMSLSDLFLFTGNPFNGFTAAYFILNFFWVHIPFLIALVGADVLAGEEANGTFRVYAIRPVSRAMIFISKTLAAFIYTLSLVLFFALFSLGLGLAWHGGGDMLVFQDGILILEAKEAVKRFILAFGLSTLNMGLVSAIAIFFSSMVRNAVGPVIGTMAVIVLGIAISTLPFEIFDGMRPYLFTSYFRNWELAFYDPLPWRDLLLGVWNIVGTSIAFLLGAYWIFHRKDILS